MDNTLIIALIALIGSLASILVPLLKKPHEVKKIDADTVKTYAEAAKLSAERAEASAKIQDEKIAELMSYVEDLEDLVDRLSKQVIGAGLIPVKIRQRKKKETA